MSNDGKTNDREFWEAYFRETWELNDGPGQSRHFMLQLLAHLPLAELAWLMKEQLDILDWGCATGEGTEALAVLLPNSSVTGLDFAQLAVQEAGRRHQFAKFVWQEEGSIATTFDVIVTSNCLEHFEDPMAIASAHIKHCRYLYIALVPYREHPLHEQHVAQFRLESFPDKVGSFVRLDVIPFPIANLYWPGEQVMAIYASEDYVAERRGPEEEGPFKVLRNSLLGECQMSAELGRTLQELRTGQKEQERLVTQLEDRSAETERLKSGLAAAKAELDAKDTTLLKVRYALDVRTKVAREAVSALERSSRRAGRVYERLARAKQQASDAAQRFADAEKRLLDEKRSHEEKVHKLETQINDLASQVNDLSAQLGESTRLLKREETTVLRPVLRTAWRNGRAVARHLPADWQDAIRAKLAPAVQRLAPRSAQAVFYEVVRQRRSRGYSEGVACTETGLSGGMHRVLPSEGTPGGESTFWRSWVDPGDRLTVFIFSVISWDFRIQRPQQLARSLGALGHTVYYVQPEFSDRPVQPYKIEGNPVPNVYLCRLACPSPHPKIYEKLLSGHQLRSVADNLSRVVAERSSGAIVRLVQHPFWASLMRQWDVGFLVYDMMDDHSGFLGNGEWLQEEETDLIKIADLITVSSRALMSKAGRTSKVALLTNGAELDYFAQVPPRAHDAGPVRIGYYGAISSWFDSELVEYCAKRHPEWQFELIGSTFQADLRSLGGLKNVTLRGEQPYSSIAKCVADWDVAIIPFKIVPLTEATNPVKAYEYLAAGKPVVATRLPELGYPPLVDWVRTATGPEEFLQVLEAEVATARDSRLAEERRRSVKGHSWSDRAKVLDNSIRALAPRVSVIIVCYGRLSLTMACLESLLTRTAYPDWELIVVDNNSPDETASWLRDVSALSGRVRPVFLDSNRGFAGGVNEGVRWSTGQYLVIMNNDVTVTPGWMGKLVRHLQVEADLGLVGPVTNAIGNEAAISINYSTMVDMVRASERYTAAHFRELIDVENVAFFMVGLARSTWDAVGELDESYGLGYFEDDDYCVRVRRLGKRIGIAEDVFVHHELSASFDMLGTDAKRAQFEASKAVFEQKWGSWQPHKYRREMSVPRRAGPPE